jgi:hypothetical protein
VNPEIGARSIGTFGLYFFEEPELYRDIGFELGATLAVIL